MSVLNQYVCAAAGANTGIPDCAVTLKNLKYGFLVPNSFELTEAQLATADSALAALQSAAVSDNPATRIYPLPTFESVTDNTEDVVSETIGGTPFIVRDGKYNLLFRYVKGGQCVSNSLAKFNNGNYRFIGVDSAGVLFGTKDGTSLKGIPLDYFYSRPFRIATDSTIANFSFQIVFDSVYLNTGLGFISLNLADVYGIVGLKNINLSLVAPRVAGVFTLKTKTGCSGVDLYDTFGTQLAIVSNWAVTRLGNLVTLTSVVKGPNTKGLVFTLDTADPDYNVAGPFLVSGAGVSSLVTNGVSGYEILPLTVA